MPSFLRTAFPLNAVILAFVPFQIVFGAYERVQHASAHADQSTSLGVTLDRAPDPGNLLLLYFGARHSTEVTLPDGWKVAWDLNHNQRFVVAYKKATENESSSIIVDVNRARELVLLVEERYPAEEIDGIIATHSAGEMVNRLSTGCTNEPFKLPQHAIAAFMVQNANWGGEMFSNDFSVKLRAGQNNATRPYIITAEKELSSVEGVETALHLSGSSRMIGGLLTIIPGPAPEHRPGALRSVSRRANSIDLEWGESTGGVYPRTSQLQFSEAGREHWVSLGGKEDERATVRGLAEGTEYDFRVCYEDADGCVVYSDIVRAETSNVPIAVIEDDMGNTSGVIERMGPCMVGFLMTGSEFGAGDFGNVKPEWHFGDENAPYNELRGFGVGHFFDIDREIETRKTVTLTLTNVDQETDVATRTVVITPNTRQLIYIDPDIGTANPENPSDPADPFDTPKNAWEATSGSDLEFVLTAGKTHRWETMFDGRGRRHNIIVRSSEKGTKAFVAAHTTLIGGGNQLGIRDLHFVPAGGDNARRILDARYTSASPSTQCWALDCTSEDPMVVPGITDHASYFNLWQNVQTDDATSINSLWGAGDGTIILGCHIRHGGNSKPERPMRMKGDHVLVWDTVATAHTSKSAFTRNGGRWLWIGNCTFSMESGNGNPLALTHNHASTEGRVSCVVVERVLLTAPLGTAGDHAMLHIGQNNQDAQGVVIRNVICDGGLISAKQDFEPGQLLEDIRIYNVTIFHDKPSEPYISFRDSLHRNLTIQSVLGVSGGMQTRSTIRMMGDMPDLFIQMPWIHGNIMPPVHSDSDITVGQNSETWKAWNDRKPFFGTQNRSKSVMLDPWYRPMDMDDPDLIVEMPRDMVNFQEDFYGNPRSPDAWYIGAVGLEADAAAQ